MSKADIGVHGRLYSVACAPGQEARLSELGVRLDKRVDQIAGAVGDVGEARLLLIAALALMDELDAAKTGAGMTALEAKAATALSDAATRIDAIAARLEPDRQGG
jgi:cell division protein ZapA